MKWDPPSLMTIRGVAKRGNMSSWNIRLACLELTTRHGITSTHLDTVHGHQDVLAILGLREWPHEINPPYIKVFYLEIVHERHRISRVDVPVFLTSVASPNKVLCIMIHCWPVKATLPDLGMCPKCSIMSFVW